MGLILTSLPIILRFSCSMSFIRTSYRFFVKERALPDLEFLVLPYPCGRQPYPRKLMCTPLEFLTRVAILKLGYEATFLSLFSSCFLPYESFECRIVMPACYFSAVFSSDIFSGVVPSGGLLSFLLRFAISFFSSILTRALVALLNFFPPYC